MDAVALRMLKPQPLPVTFQYRLWLSSPNSIHRDVSYSMT